jgi:stage II sporulation protein D
MRPCRARPWRALGRLLIFAATAVTASASTATSPGEEIRVLLQRTSRQVELPQPGRVYRASWPGGNRRLVGPLTVRLASAHQWQVAAVRSRDSARAIVDRLQQALGPAVTVSEHGREVIRIRATWSDSAPAGAASQLAALGFDDAFPTAARSIVVSEGEAAASLASSDEIELRPEGDWPVAIGGHRYWGSLRLRLAADTLLVINLIDLESYLRGVVPSEMNPRDFPEIEALKAQAVAARTYALRHLGEHAGEGYDLCATPTCQAYDGCDGEHPLSSRAVGETAGLVLVWQDEPIEALYTSTCGGHTEDVANVFVGSRHLYLRGVPCAWERPLHLQGTGTGGAWQPADTVMTELARGLLGLEAASSGAHQVLDRVCQLSAAPPPAAGRHLESASAFAGALLTATGLDPGAIHLVTANDPLTALLDLGDLFGLTLAPPTTPWNQGWHLLAALAVLELSGVVEHDRGEAVPRPDGVGIYPEGAARSATIPAGALLFERRHGAMRSVARGTVLPGARLERLRLGRSQTAIVIDRSVGGGEADRRSAWRSWRRELTWRELGERLGMADPISIEVTRRSASGRVIGLAVESRSGQRRHWQLFDVRRALGLPETLFGLHRARRADGSEVVRFLGRGWGHGVGLCQNGSFGLARSGLRFEAILATYYPGTELVPLARVASWIAARREPESGLIGQGHSDSQ